MNIWCPDCVCNHFSLLLVAVTGLPMLVDSLHSQQEVSIMQFFYWRGRDCTNQSTQFGWSLFDPNFCLYEKQKKLLQYWSHSQLLPFKATLTSYSLKFLIAVLYHYCYLSIYNSHNLGRNLFLYHSYYYLSLYPSITLSIYHSIHLSLYPSITHLSSIYRLQTRKLWSILCWPEASKHCLVLAAHTWVAFVYQKPRCFSPKWSAHAYFSSYFDNWKTTFL